MNDVWRLVYDVTRIMPIARDHCHAKVSRSPRPPMPPKVVCSVAAWHGVARHGAARRGTARHSVAL
eukprot:3317179-Lingulodinium_polyedra.AAC.1